MWNLSHGLILRVPLLPGVVTVWLHDWEPVCLYSPVLDILINREGSSRCLYNHHKSPACIFISNLLSKLPKALELQVEHSLHMASPTSSSASDHNPQVCDVCGANAANSSALAKHKNLVHGVNYFPCQVINCDFATLRQDSLNDQYVLRPSVLHQFPNSTPRSYHDCCIRTKFSFTSHRTHGIIPDKGTQFKMYQPKSKWSSILSNNLLQNYSFSRFAI